MTTATLPQNGERRHRAETILEKSVCLTLRCSYLGNNRKVPLETMVEAAGGENELSEEQFHATMRLVDPKALTPVKCLIRDVKSYLRRRAIAAPQVFGERNYLLPIAIWEEVDEALTSKAAEIRTAALALSETYADLVAAQATKLGKAFDPAKYPTTAQVRDAFSIAWGYTSFAAPDKIETLPKAVADRVRAKSQATLNDIFDETKAVLRLALREFVGEVVSKLRPTDDGKPKVFRNTILRDIADFIDSFGVRDVTNDAELGALVQHLRDVTHGVDADALRDMPTVRDHVFAEMQEAAKAIDGMIATGRRAISFGGGL